MQVVLLSSDLMLASAAQGPAARAGVRLVIAAAPTQALAAAADPQTVLVAIDLRTPGLDPAAFMAKVRAHDAPPPVLACAPHVHEASLAAAVQAGCDEATSRSQFERRLADWLERVASRG